MAVSVKMSSKNQIVVPKAGREALGLVPGDRLLVEVRDDGVLEMRKQPVDLADELEGVLASLERPAAGAAGDLLWTELRLGEPVGGLR